MQVTIHLVTFKYKALSVARFVGLVGSGSVLIRRDVLLDLDFFLPCEDFMLQWS